MIFLTYVRTRRIRNRARLLMATGIPQTESYQVAEVVEWLRDDARVLTEAILASDAAPVRLALLDTALRVGALRATEITAIADRLQLTASVD